MYHTGWKHVRNFWMTVGDDALKLNVFLKEQWNGQSRRDTLTTYLAVSSLEDNRRE